MDSHNFDYFVPLDGDDRPDSHDQPIQELNVTHVTRNFSGLYAQAEWTPVSRLRVEAGFRLNHTREGHRAVNHPLASGDDPETPVDDSKTLTRGGGIAGINWLAGAGLTWNPARGLTAWGTANYVGSRFLNKRNTALAPSYTTWSAGLGYTFDSWQIRLAGTNLNDTRPPVAESEFGDAQYYILPARQITLSGTYRF